MTGPVALTRLRWWHLDQVLAIEAAAYPGQPWSATAFWSELGQLDSRHYLVALHEGAVVGYAGLCDYPDEAWVQTLAVAPAVQRRGVGGLLLRALLEEAGRRSQPVVQLEVRASNAVAQRLYARHGFARTGLRRRYYPPTGEDAVLMTRRA